MRKIYIFLSTKLTFLSVGHQGSVENIFATGYRKENNKLNEVPVRPEERKAKAAEDINLLDKKPEASEALNVCSTTDKFSRHLWVCMPKSLPFPRSCPSVSPIHYRSGSWLPGL